MVGRISCANPHKQQVKSEAPPSAERTPTPPLPAPSQPLPPFMLTSPLMMLPSPANMYSPHPMVSAPTPGAGSMFSPGASLDLLPPAAPPAVLAPLLLPGFLVDDSADSLDAMEVVASALPMQVLLDRIAGQDSVAAQVSRMLNDAFTLVAGPDLRDHQTMTTTGSVVLHSQPPGIGWGVFFKKKNFLTRCLLVVVTGYSGRIVQLPVDTAFKYWEARNLEPYGGPRPIR
jgi:hypothetical protein